MTLYHGGDLVDGLVQPGTFSTTTDLAHAEQYAEMRNGFVCTFEVPLDKLYEMQESGTVQMARDKLEGTDSFATEWRFFGDASTQLNPYRVP